jgi:CDP-glucose 4,6-dehydratase
VIGGGDFALDRIIPDCIRAAQKKQDIIVRNPYSTRPYQHVLEPVAAYLMIVKAQYEDMSFASNYNVGPDENDCWTTGNLVSLFCDKWNRATGDGIKWIDQYDGGPHEANYLKLDCSKLKRALGWKPRWTVEVAMDKIVEWSKVYFEDGDVSECMKEQIMEFLKI